MDKMIHLSLHTLDIALRKQAISAQNLSNMNVTGSGVMCMKILGRSIFGRRSADTPVFAMTTGSGEFDEQQGRMRLQTSPPIWLLMVKVFLCLSAMTYETSLTRRGDMSVSMEGNLVNGQGAVILSETLQPIQVPPFREI